MTEAEVSYYEMKERDGFCLTEAFLQELQEDVDLLFLANPNNPVGNTIEDMLLEKICDRCREKKITVVIDVCFLEFTRKKGFFETHSMQEYPNVIIVKAFTKLYAIPMYGMVLLQYSVSSNAASPAASAMIEMFHSGN